MGEVTGPETVIVNNEESRGHEGKLFVSDKVTESVANSATVDILLVTDGLDSHLVSAVSAGGDVYVELFEDVVVSSNGTEIVPINVNRNSSLTSLIKTYHTPTISSTGTQLRKVYLSGGGGGNSQGVLGAGLARPNTEIVLKKNTKYLLRVTNKSGQAKTIGVEVMFYEKSIN